MILGLRRVLGDGFGTSDKVTLGGQGHLGRYWGMILGLQRVLGDGFETSGEPVHHQKFCHEQRDFHFYSPKLGAKVLILWAENKFGF